MLSRRATCALFCILSSFLVGFGPPVLTDSDVPTKRLTLGQMRAMEHVDVPEVTAAAVVVVNDTTGEIVHAINAHERRAPASLTKMVTALVALERGRQDREIEVLSKDLSVWSVMNLQAGEELTMRQLLFMLLIPSDNAAARVIGRAIAGNVPAFVDLMNAKVQSFGLKDTHFANPSGLDDPDGYSSAYDLAVIARNAMRDPVFADIVGRSSAIAAWRNLDSTNELLDTYPGAVGVKTGTEELAGECLITMVDRPEGTVICVVLGSEDRFSDSRLLLDWYYATYGELTVDLPENMQNRYLDEANNWHDFSLEQPKTFLVSPWLVDSADFYRRIDIPSTTPDPQRPIGALEVHLAGQLYTEVPIYARQ